jgi:hypothetical protein
MGGKSFRQNLALAMRSAMVREPSWGALWSSAVR